MQWVIKALGIWPKKTGVSLPVVENELYVFFLPSFKKITHITIRNYFS